MLVKTNSDNQEELDSELHNQNGEEILASNWSIPWSFYAW